jgi:hypothetical protein
MARQFIMRADISQAVIAAKAGIERLGFFV